MPIVYGSADRSGGGVRIRYLKEIAGFFMWRCQVFNISAGEPVLEIVVKPGMAFLWWFA